MRKQTVCGVGALVLVLLSTGCAVKLSWKFNPCCLGGKNWHHWQRPVVAPPIATNAPPAVATPPIATNAPPPATPKAAVPTSAGREVVYLPGASATWPCMTHFSGWPLQLTDTNGVGYTRIKDGEPETPYRGFFVIYKKDGASSLHVPRLRSRTTEDVGMHTLPQ